MLAVQDMVKVGYRSLAQRTLRAYERIEPYIHSSHPEDLRRLREFKGCLETLRLSGDLMAQGESAKRSFGDALDQFNQAVPPQFKPSDAQGALAVASIGIRNYYGIPDFKTLLERAKINEIRFATEAGLALMERDGSIHRIFFAAGDLRRPVLAVVANIHEFIHALDARQERILEICSKLDQIPGMRNFTGKVIEDSAISRKRIDVVRSSHDLNFFSLPEVIELADQNGVDVDRLREFLAEHSPVMDFVVCSDEGNAYLKQGQVVRTMPGLSSNPPLLAAYELVALIDALRAGFVEPKKKYYLVGIGIYEYCETEPGTYEQIRESKEFHRELAAYLRA